MRSGILFLPFVSFFAAILALATQKAYASMPYVGIALWFVAAVCIVSWGILDANRIGRMFKRKGAKHGLSQGLSVVLAILLALGIGFVTKRDRFNKTFDVTKEGLNTLSPESQKLVNQLKANNQIITIHGFFQDEVKKAQFNKVLALYQSTGLSLAVEYIDPQTDPTRAMAESITVPDTVLIKLGKQEARLTSFSEEKFSNALVRVMKDKEHVVYFLSGHGEPDITSKEAVGLSLAKAELESERFVVKTAKLMEIGKYPDDADLVVIAGPKYDLLPAEKEILEKAMLDAKPLMILVDALVDLPNIKALAVDAGIKMNDDLLIIRPDDPRAKMLGQNNAIVTDLDKVSPITADFAKRGGVAFVTANTRSLDVVADNKLHLKTVTLARTAAMIIKVQNVRTEKDLQGGVKENQIQTGAFDVFAVSTGQVGGDRLAANQSMETKDVTADGKGKSSKELRVFVGGTAQLATNLGAQRGENLDLFVNGVNFLLQDEDFLSIRAKDSDPSRLDLTTSSSQFLLIFLAFIYPLIFGGVGSFYWVRRRRA
ncbi:MAG: Gldg family protein [Chitinophagaceae bacterium]|nr:Gldg family protein [Oligoflexus sp.]